MLTAPRLSPPASPRWRLPLAPTMRATPRCRSWTSGLDATLGDVEAALRTLVTAGRAVPVAHFDSPMYRAAPTAPRT